MEVYSVALVLKRYWEVRGHFSRFFAVEFLEEGFYSLVKANNTWQKLLSGVFLCGFIGQL